MTDSNGVPFAREDSIITNSTSGSWGEVPGIMNEVSTATEKHYYVTVEAAVWSGSFGSGIPEGEQLRLRDYNEIEFFSYTQTANNNTSPKPVYLDAPLTVLGPIEYLDSYQYSGSSDDGHADNIKGNQISLFGYYR